MKSYWNENVIPVNVWMIREWNSLIANVERVQWSEQKSKEAFCISKSTKWSSKWCGETAASYPEDYLRTLMKVVTLNHRFSMQKKEKLLLEEDAI